MLNIKGLQVEVNESKVIDDLTLNINAGEIHVIMGPNGSGKSTLSYALSGKENYEVTAGEILFQEKNLLELEIEERALAGLFLAFQYPVEIAGVNSIQFLKHSLNALRKHRGEDSLDAYDFLALVQEKMAQLNLNSELMKRAVNAGFSGGEKKKFDILQMLLLDPSFVILDEIDSGLDIDALKTIADNINTFKQSGNKSILVITHYQRLLDYVKPDFVHILHKGRIVESGGAEVAIELEKHGYSRFGIQL